MIPYRRDQEGLATSHGPDLISPARSSDLECAMLTLITKDRVVSSAAAKCSKGTFLRRIAQPGVSSRCSTPVGDSVARGSGPNGFP